MNESAIPARRELPDTRRSETHRVRIEEDGAVRAGGGQVGSIVPAASGGGWTAYITVGFFDDGTPGEVFITIGKLGTPMRGALDMVAIFISNALQWGVPLEELIHTLRGHNFPPHGATSNPDIPQCASIPDYVGQLLQLRHMAEAPSASPPRTTEVWDELPASNESADSTARPTEVTELRA